MPLGFWQVSCQALLVWVLSAACHGDAESLCSLPALLVFHPSDSPLGLRGLLGRCFLVALQCPPCPHHTLAVVEAEADSPEPPAGPPLSAGVLHSRGGFQSHTSAQGRPHRLTGLHSDSGMMGRVLWSGGAEIAVTLRPLHMYFSRHGDTNL